VDAFIAQAEVGMCYEVKWLNSEGAACLWYGTVAEVHGHELLAQYWSSLVEIPVAAGLDGRKKTMTFPGQVNITGIAVVDAPQERHAMLSDGGAQVVYAKFGQCDWLSDLALFAGEQTDMDEEFRNLYEEPDPDRITGGGPVLATPESSRKRPREHDDDARAMRKDLIDESSAEESSDEHEAADLTGHGNDEDEEDDDAFVVNTHSKTQARRAAALQRKEKNHVRTQYSQKRLQANADLLHTMRGNAEVAAVGELTQQTHRNVVAVGEGVRGLTRSLANSVGGIRSEWRAEKQSLDRTVRNAVQGQMESVTRKIVTEVAEKLKNELRSELHKVRDELVRLFRAQPQQLQTSAAAGMHSDIPGAAAKSKRNPPRVAVSLPGPVRVGSGMRRGAGWHVWRRRGCVWWWRPHGSVRRWHA
jgi:hypothetical protein